MSSYLLNPCNIPENQPCTSSELNQNYFVTDQGGGSEHPASQHGNPRTVPQPWGCGQSPGTAQHVPDDPGEAGRAVPVPTQRLQRFLQDVVAVAAQELLPRRVLADVGGVSEGKLVFIRGRAWGVLQAPGGVLSHLK